jgi:hypothetical protein
MSIAQLRATWLGNVRADVLAGLVVGLALTPEAIPLLILAGVDPKVVLYAAFSMAVPSVRNRALAPRRSVGSRSSRGRRCSVPERTR